MSMYSTAIFGILSGCSQYLLQPSAFFCANNCLTSLKTDTHKYDNELQYEHSLGKSSGHGGMQPKYYEELSLEYVWADGQKL